MNKRIATLALAITLILPAAGTFAATKTKTTAKPAAKTMSSGCPYMGSKTAMKPGGKNMAATCPFMGATKKPVKPAKPAAKTISAVCPVMGTKIPDIRKAAGKSVYKGKTYYFCCAGCKPQFDKNPEKYIHKHK